MPDAEAFTLAAVNSSLLKERLVAFNQQHPEYRLTLREYVWKNEPDEVDPIQLALLEQDVPDLVEIRTEVYLNYARKGYLQDLTDYVETSEVLSQEDYIPSIWEAMQINGRIYSLPEQFSVSMIALPESAVGNKTNWTIERMPGFLMKLWKKGLRTGRFCCKTNYCTGLELSASWKENMENP